MQSATKLQPRSCPSPRRALLGLALAVTAALAWTPAARAQVTVGAPLGLPANTAEGCETVVFPSLREVVGVPPSCTFFGADSAGNWTSQTPRGRWLITRARVRTGPRVGPMVFTVIRTMRSQATSDQPPFVAGTICCTTPFESQVFTPAPNSVNTIPVRIPVVNTVEVIDGEPIEVVDYLGITLLSLASSVPIHLATPGGPGQTSNTSFIAPAIRPGEQRLSDGTLLQPSVLLVNADYQAAGVGPPPAGAPPRLSALDLARVAFAAAPRGPSVRAAARGVPVGTKVNYTLADPATTRFNVERRKAGRRVGGKCRKRTARNSGRKKCNLRLKGTFKHKGAQGANSFRFTGRLKGRKLKPGSYNLVAWTKGEDGKKSKAKRHRFKILSP